MAELQEGFLDKLKTAIKTSTAGAKARAAGDWFREKARQAETVEQTDRRTATQVGQQREVGQQRDTDIQTDWLTDRQTDRQRNRHTDRETDREAGRRKRHRDRERGSATEM